VLFLFVIALLSATKELERTEQKGLTVQRIAGFSIGGAMLLMLALVGLVGGLEYDTVFPAVATEFGEVGHFGWALFTTHVFPFEVLAFILMVAVIGVVILVGRQKA
jgi:NADH-quinone oxidoreductase subunit J